MYLSNIKLWNFRKYGSDSDLGLRNPDYLDHPNLDLNFTDGLNVLIGANDSGKSAILDAIKLVLKTNSYEWIRIQEDDFYIKDTHNKSTKFRIELIFSDLEDKFSSFFPEHLTVEGEGENAVESLNLVFEIFRNNERIFPSDVKAGKNGELGTLSAEQKELLSVTYLKPLRDVKSEFIPKKNSRLSNILEGHKAFKGKGHSHELYTIFTDFNKKIEEYFVSGVGGDRDGVELKNDIDKYIQEFLEKTDESIFSVTPGELRHILEKLELALKENINPGLGTLNRLFIASELLHLQKDGFYGLQLGLIEEIEAHIHPQAQMKVIESLQKRINEKGIQIILTTHSPNLVSKVKLQNLIICENNRAFPMGKKYTNLGEENYRFLERFLDITKSNLFFSEGVILVEGWAEEIILPNFARLLKKLGVIQKDFIDSQIEIVNVGSDSFFRYAKIFERIDEPHMDKRVAIISDMDLRPDKFRYNPKVEKKLSGVTDIDEQKAILKKYNIYSGFSSTEIREEKDKKSINIQGIRTFLTDEQNWTLEYSLGLFTKFQEALFHSIKEGIIQMREDVSTTYSRSEETRDFISITGSDSDKAFEIYNNIMLEKKVSKPIVAQYFANFLENEIDKIETNEDGSIISNRSIFEDTDFEEDSSISYLVNAIKYAIGE